MKKVLVILGGAFAAFLLIVACIGTFSSPDFNISSSITVNAKSEMVYVDIANLQSWVDWSVWNHEADKDCDHKYEGPAIGKGAKWIWKGSEPPEGLGEGTMIITAGDPATGIEYQLDFVGFGTMLGQVKLEETDGKTLVTWSSKGSVPDEFFFRLLNGTGMMESAILEEYDKCLKSLKTRAEKRAEGGAVEGTPVEASHKKK